LNRDNLRFGSTRLPLRRVCQRILAAGRDTRVDDTDEMKFLLRFVPQHFQVLSSGGRYPDRRTTRSSDRHPYMYRKNTRSSVPWIGDLSDNSAWRI